MAGMLDKARAILAGLRDPSTKAGTAFWTALVVALLDVLRHGLTWPAVCLLAGWAGVGGVAQWVAGRGADAPAAGGGEA